MTFIITLISLVIERFFHWSHLRHWRWFNMYQQWLSHSRISRLPSVALFILSVLPLICLVGLINYFLNGWLYGILKIAFGIVVLLYCLGPANLWVQAYRCISQLQKDENPAVAMESVQQAFGFAAVDTAQSFHHAFTRALFMAASERVFSVVFWFVLLGPAGAVLYRSIALMNSTSPLGLESMAQKARQWLDWIPVRLLTFIFALGGHFTRVFAVWKKTVLKRPETNDVMLTECGIAALDMKEDGLTLEDVSAEKDAIVLLDRVFVMALLVLAIAVLIV